MTKTSSNPKERISQTVPHRLWDRLSQTNQRAVVAILAACLFRQVSDLKTRPTQREVQHKPTTR